MVYSLEFGLLEGAMKWSSAVSESSSIEEALDQCVESVRADLGPEAVDLAVVFASPHFGESYDQIPGMVERRLSPKHLIGCSAGGVIGGGHEVEQRAGFSLTVASMPGVSVTPFHVSNEDLPDLDASPSAWESMVGTTAEKGPQFLLITDPFTIRSDNLLLGLDYAFKYSVKVGGMASGGQHPAANALMLDGKVHRSGAVGLAFHGDVVIDTIVAQGCRPIGKPMNVTKCNNNVLLGLDGAPAVEVLRELFGVLSDRDKELARHSLFLGVVMDEFQEYPQLGDFLIRNIVGMDPRQGALAIGERLREGQIVQFHLRDAQTSTEDLTAMVNQYKDRFRETRVSGALLFSCLGRGQYLYGEPDHDTGIFREMMGEIPVGGFFCNGEIGPVQGTTYLHGYTSSFGLFRAAS